MKIKFKIVLVVLCFFTELSFAQVNLSQTKKMNLPQTQDAVILSKDFVDHVLPKEIQQNEGGNSVLSKMADNSFSYWWATTPLRNTALGQAADAVEKKARLQMEVKGSSDVTHKFDLKILVMQALARFEYKGWINAGINYDARASETVAEIIQSIAKDKELIVSQKFTPNESTSRLSLKFNW